MESPKAGLWGRKVYLGGPACKTTRGQGWFGQGTGLGSNLGWLRSNLSFFPDEENWSAKKKYLQSHMAGQWQSWSKGPGFLMPPGPQQTALPMPPASCGRNWVLSTQLRVVRETVGWNSKGAGGGQWEHQPADENEDGPLDLSWSCVGLIAVLAFSGLLGRQMDMVTIRWGCKLMQPP